MPSAPSLSSLARVCVSATAVATLGLAPAVAVAAPHAAAPPVSAHADGGKGGTHDRLAREIARLDTRLARVARKLGRLPAQAAETVAAHVAEDRALLAGLTTRAEVRAVRPEVYDVAIALLHKASRTEVQVATNPASPANDEAAAALATAMRQVLELGATSSKAEVAAAKRAVRHADDLADAAAPASDDGDDDVVDPVIGDEPPKP